ncbi:hypothetical protein [Cognatilysobacter xinjiangensis]|uniref:hypothetical protein n=1 Tax=Cognatilysobacter xinjiangensis TaxID=546892 RepID=UPI001E57DC38|nr:hypothetical protein [Lysobacter xinjiangensis]
MTGPGDRGNDDGVRVVEHPRRPVRPWVLAVLAAVIAAGTVYRVTMHRAGGLGAAADNEASSPGTPPTARDATLGDRSAGAATATGATPVTHVAPRDGEDPTRDLSDYVLPGEAPSMAEVIAALQARGIRTGLGAFQPPGTSPPLRGLEVPEGFELPPGYVRHFQATDDGQRIAPILMFSPDVTPLDASGRPLTIPADRVVPPELAPPGMPRRWVRIPPPRAGGTS